MTLSDSPRSGEQNYPQPSEAASTSTVLSIGDTFYVEVDGKTIAIEVAV